MSYRRSAITPPNFKIGNSIMFNTISDNIFPTNSYQIGDLGISSLSLHLGSGAGFLNQQTGAIALGYNAGNTNQGTGAIAIGYNCGISNQGEYSIAIGNNAGVSSQSPNSIVINAGTGASITPSVSGLFVSPLRGLAVGAGVNVLIYNPSTSEIYYSTT
jgi:hypothetical protein